MQVLVERGRRVSLLLVQERSRGILVHVGSRAAAIWARDRLELLVRLAGWVDGVLSFPAAWTHEEGLFLEIGIPRFLDSVVPVRSRTGEDTVYSFTP